MKQITAQGLSTDIFPCTQITSQCLLVAISLALRNAWCHPSPHLA